MKGATLITIKVMTSYEMKGTALISIKGLPLIRIKKINRKML